MNNNNRKNFSQWKEKWIFVPIHFLKEECVFPRTVKPKHRLISSSVCEYWVGEGKKHTNSNEQSLHTSNLMSKGKNHNGVWALDWCVRKGDCVCVCVCVCVRVCCGVCVCVCMRDWCVWYFNVFVCGYSCVWGGMPAQQERLLSRNASQSCRKDINGEQHWRCRRSLTRGTCSYFRWSIGSVLPWPEAFPACRFFLSLLRIILFHDSIK
jgi:hypothetical protein